MAMQLEEALRLVEKLKEENTILKRQILPLLRMADAAEQWYWKLNKAYLSAVGEQEKVFDCLRELGRYPPPDKHQHLMPTEEPPDAQ